MASNNFLMPEGMFLSLLIIALQTILRAFEPYTDKRFL